MSYQQEILGLFFGTPCTVTQLVHGSNFSQMLFVYPTMTRVRLSMRTEATFAGLLTT